MIIDMNGYEKKPKKKKKKKKRLSHEEMIHAIKNIIDENCDDFCLFYSRGEGDFKWSNCHDTRIDAFIENHKRDKLEDLIFDCLARYFNHDDANIEFYSIDNEQEWIDEFIEKLAKDREEEGEE